MEQKKAMLKNEIFTVPNILVFIRVLLVPVFVALYIQNEFYWAFGVMATAFLTDFLDGKIARKFNCITDLGKTIDPIADKIYQFAVALCLIVKYPLIISVAIVLFIKEISMGVMGLILLSKGGKVFGAKWYGKLSTAVLDISMVFLLVTPLFSLNISPKVTDIIIYVCNAVLIFSAVMYTRLYIGKIKELD